MRSDDREEILRLKKLLSQANEEVQDALSQLNSACDTLKSARRKLQETEAENRRVKLLLLRYVESPNPDEAEAIIRRFESPCGMAMCDRSEPITRLLRKYIVANKFLQEEIERLKNGTDSR